VALQQETRPTSLANDVVTILRMSGLRAIGVNAEAHWQFLVEDAVLILGQTGCRTERLNCIRRVGLLREWRSLCGFNTTMECLHFSGWSCRSWCCCWLLVEISTSGRPSLATRARRTNFDWRVLGWGYIQ